MQWTGYLYDCNVGCCRGLCDRRLDWRLYTLYLTIFSIFAGCTSNSLRPEINKTDYFYEKCTKLAAKFYFAPYRGITIGGSGVDTKLDAIESELLSAVSPSLICSVSRM